MTTEYLLNEQVERVLGLLMPSNRLVMRVCLHTGLRVGDVLSLRTEQLQSDAGRWWIKEAKTGKSRMVAVPQDLLSELRGHAGAEWVFPSRLDGRKHRTRQAVWADVKRAAKSMRLDVNVGPHSFRKTYAVNLLEKYGDIKRVQRALNHSSQSVTMIYAMADKLLTQPHRKPRRRA